MFKRLFSLLGLLVFLVMATGSLSFGPVAAVTITQIMSSTRTAVNILTLAKTITENANTAVEDSYAELGQLLRSKNIGSEEILLMENNLRSMRARADSLDYALGIAEDSGEQLFDLLRRRAKENETRSLRNQMLEGIEVKEEGFEQRIEIAEEGLEKINSSIQKYDDILGFLQVSEGLNNEEYLNAINDVISEGDQFNREMQSAIEEGLEILSNAGGVDLEE